MSQIPKSAQPIRVPLGIFAVRLRSVVLPASTNTIPKNAVLIGLCLQTLSGYGSQRLNSFVVFEFLLTIRMPLVFLPAFIPLIVYTSSILPVLLSAITCFTTDDSTRFKVAVIFPSYDLILRVLSANSSITKRSTQSLPSQPVRLFLLPVLIKKSLMSHVMPTS